MRLSLDLRQDGHRPLGGLGRRAAVAEAPAPARDHVVAASETVALVLGEDSPLPETATDVADLVRLLRGHVAQLGVRTAPGAPTLLRAQRLCSDSIPEDYVASRVYVVRLAEATRELVACVESGEPEPVSVAGGRRWRRRRPTVNVLRGAVFALALACLVFAASVPRT
ncbi:DUF6415 family natural product biosynthesis protein [Streptomyces sp. bgisy060]|uniref:DUF6415 family natural product biosynthesis protein n=1 Tax=Streptomyces sp. bgisy060 TaxID=3413775 RepID=UPI003EB7C5E2